ASATPGGYLLADSSGRVSSCGSSQYFGSVVDPGGFNEVSQPASFGFPIVGISSAPSNQGYWEADSQGHIYTFGNVQFYGDASSQPLRNPIVGIGSTPDGKGYWLVASDGGVFAYGDAQFYGSTGSLTLSRPIVGMISTSDGEGYWLVASDGGVFAFGDAGFYGSKGATILNRPIVGMAATPVGAGYWLIASDGGVFAFGDATFLGSFLRINPSLPSSPSNSIVPCGQMAVGISVTADGGGYWVATSNGNVVPFGDAPFEGTVGTPPIQNGNNC
ncbi:MAG TPA: hypothetical protein VMU77_02835, partial [Acidimicrobiales bacterium]|nr:hypothetical protein [Acidimicrobiales bacterium]